MEAPCCSATTSTRRFPVNQIPALHFHVLANQVVPEIALTLRELPTAPDPLKLTFGEYGKQVASTVDLLIGEVGPTGTPPFFAWQSSLTHIGGRIELVSRGSGCHYLLFGLCPPSRGFSSPGASAMRCRRRLVHRR